jgi:hypothetical protein
MLDLLCMRCIIPARDAVMEQLARAQTMALRMATLRDRVSPALSTGRRLFGEAGST